MSQAFESIVKAAHLNLTKNTAEAYGGLMLMQSSIFDRLGRLIPTHENVQRADHIVQGLPAKHGAIASSFSNAMLNNHLLKT